MLPGVLSSSYVPRPLLLSLGEVFPLVFFYNCMGLVTQVFYSLFRPRASDDTVFGFGLLLAFMPNCTSPETCFSKHL